MAEIKLSTTRYEHGRLSSIAAIIGVLGLGVTAVGAVLDSRSAAFAWLTAFAFAVSVAVGGLLFLMIGYTIGAKWPTAIRRLTESVAGAFPVLAVAFVPIVLYSHAIYLWAGPRDGLDAHMVHLLEHKERYLNVPFFAIRGAFYFLVWSIASILLRRWSFHADEPGASSIHPKARSLSAGLLPLVALTITFASVDWLMSLEPAWYSSMFGVYYFAGGFVTSIGLVTLLTATARRLPSLRAALTTSHFHALGRLLLSFSVFWAYIAFFQAFLIRIAAKPEELAWYDVRTHGGWAYVVVVLVAGRFVLPFFLLLPRSIKHKPQLLAVVGAAFLVLHYLDIFWLVAPVAPGHAPWPSWIDLAAVLGLCGLTVAFAAKRLQGRALLPVGDPHLTEALAYRSPL